jgi:predicted nucleic acid-binding protein
MNNKTYLVDTTVWIEYFRRKKGKKNLEIINLIRKLEAEARIVTCGIILAEFICGLGKSQKELMARQMVELHDYLEIPKEVYVFAAELSAKLRNKGLKTPLSDCLIAAVALSYGVTLVTDDSHFKRFFGLKLKFID